MSTPPLTIGVPVYNGERFLAETLDSILGQTFGDFVLVVSDNASTDGTREILCDYARRDSRVKLLVTESNRGAAWNYNRVLAECASPYFKWAAADDLLAPMYIERSLARLEVEPPSVILVYPQTRLIDADGKVVGTFEEHLAAPPGARPHTRFGQVIRNVVYGNVAFSVIRADALRRTRRHGNFPSADQVLIGELALVGEFRELDEPLFLRRLHEGASTRANRTPTALAHWFEPGRRAVRWPALSLFRQHLAGIRHAEITRQERALTYAAFLATWTRRQLRPRTRVRRLAGQLPG